jgi:hypothetical protein
MCNDAQLAGPVWINRIHSQLAEHDFCDPVEERGLARHVPIQDRGIPSDLVTQATHRQPFDAVTVDYFQGFLQNRRPADQTPGSAVGRVGGVRSVGACIGHGPLPRRLVSTSSRADLLSVHSMSMTLVNSVDTASNQALTVVYHQVSH